MFSPVAFWGQKDSDPPFTPFIWTAGDSKPTTNQSVIKLDFDGNILNEYVVPGNATVFGLAVDKFMNVYLACAKVSTNATVYKYDKDFNLIWSYDTGFTAQGISVDQNGNVAVSGVTRGNGQDTVFYLNKNGALQWSALPTTETTTGLGFGNDCQFDLLGNLYVVNIPRSGVTGQARKFNSSGTELWNFVHGGTLRHVRPNVTNDFVYLLGVRTSNKSVYKLTSAGSQSWVVDINLTGNGENMGLEVDAANDDVYVQKDGGTQAYRKYNSSGTQQWTATIPPFATYARMYDTTIDGEGFFYTTQQSGSPSGGYLRKYRESDRVLMWSYRHGTDSLNDRLMRVVVYPRPWKVI
jgi:hypothetical protein